MEIIPQPQRSPDAITDIPVRRRLAALLAKAGEGELFVEAMNKKMRYDEYFALMLWDAVTTGMMYFADGTIVKIDQFKDWLDLIKFLTVHLDGPAIQENKFQGINIFKVYNNIDESRV